MRLLNADDVHRLLPMQEAIGLMREAFTIISARRASLAHRQALELTEGTGLLMGAAADGWGLGCKLVAIAPGNPERGLPGSVGLVLLLDESTGMPLALIEGARLTALRTAALNGCAMDLLARADAQVALLVGCGTQAAAQAEAMALVRNLEELRVLCRDPSRTATFIDRLREKLDLPVRRVTGAEEALDGVGLVTAATNSLEPVLPGGLFPEGCHVSGIGSFRPDMQEFDQALIQRAAIFVESRETAMAEAGELMAAVGQGKTRPGDWSELGEVVMGAMPAREDRRQITFFKSVGHSVFDLVAARALYDRAELEDAGQTWQAL